MKQCNMTFFSILFVLLLTACTSSMRDTSTTYHTTQNPHDARYHVLVKAIKANPALPAITELRQVYMLTDRYKMNIATEKAIEDSLFEAMTTDKWSQCLQRAHQVIEHNYLSLNGHYAAMACSFETGKLAQGQYHESLLNMLLEAMWMSGDGESISTAFLSTTSVEITAFIEFHGFEIIQRVSHQKSANTIEVVTLKDPENGELFDWYFNIATQYQDINAHAID